MLKSYLSKRNTLIQLGAREEDLPLPPELTAAKRSEQSESDEDG
jgi:hypothetical protein